MTLMSGHQKDRYQIACQGVVDLQTTRYFVFIDDIIRACEGAGLKPGLRYVSTR